MHRGRLSLGSNFGQQGVVSPALAKAGNHRPPTQELSSCRGNLRRQFHPFESATLPVKPQSVTRFVAEFNLQGPFRLRVSQRDLRSSIRRRTGAVCNRTSTLGPWSGRGALHRLPETTSERTVITGTNRNLSQA